MSWLYIIAVIVFAIVSNVNKAGKNKGKGPSRGGMPTFGGGDDNPLRRVQRPDSTLDRDRREQADFPEPVYTEYSASYPVPDNETGEGVSLEHAGEADGIKARTDRMQREIERLHAAFDEMSTEVDTHKSLSSPDESPASVTAQSKLAQNRESLRRGLVWAEILGPPRSRQPHSSRREG